MTKPAPTYSFWVVEVNHDTGEVQIDHDATDFWISRIFEPESNVMRFPENSSGFVDRETVELDFDNQLNPWYTGRDRLVAVLDKGQK